MSNVEISIGNNQEKVKRVGGIMKTGRCLFVLLGRTNVNEFRKALQHMQQRAAKFTLLSAVVLSSFTIWFVHHQQDQEREVHSAVLSRRQ